MRKTTSLLIASLGLSILSFRTQSADSDDLFSQISSLQNQTKIEIIGLDRIQNGNKVLVSGNMEQQIQQIFAPYNHIVSRDKKGRIERIVIINKKQHQKDNRIVLPVTSEGNHFIVNAAISGTGSVWQTVDMVIDTGADLVVLPESMIEGLGLGEYKFTQAKMQTANGTADAKIGQLKEVRIAGEVVENVDVAFIADRLLGANKLLGMSVLGRYQLNIDDKNQLITLIKK